MNKFEYQEKSRKLRLPQRCPLVGYCQRWAWTLYFYNYYPAKDPFNVLKEAGDLPSDFDQKKVTLVVEPPELNRDDDYYVATNCCPEVPLFDPFHTPPFVPAEAISSFSWTKEEGFRRTDHKHFSECLEFIQNWQCRKAKPGRPAIPSKLRYQIFKRDGFKCVYCGRSAREGVTLHVDHKQSVKDGGDSSPENLVTSCSDCNFGKAGSSA